MRSRVERVFWGAAAELLELAAVVVVEFKLEAALALALALMVEFAFAGEER